MTKEESVKILAESIPSKSKVDELARNGLDALNRIAKKIVGSDSGQAQVLRAFLLSLYNGKTKVDLSEIMRLDLALRQDFCAIAMGINLGSFSDDKIKQAFVTAGDVNARWFFDGLNGGMPLDE